MNKVFIDVGAGCRDEYKFPMGGSFDRYILIEPHFVLAGALRRQLHEDNRVTIFGKALVPDASSPGSLLKIARPSLWSSLHSPTGIKSRYPRFKVVREESVELISVVDLMENLDDSLVSIQIDSCGAEAELLESFFQNIASESKISAVRVWLGESREFDTSASIESVQQLMAGRYYEGKVTDAGSRVCMDFHFSPSLKREAESKQLAIMHQEKLNSLEEELATKEAELERLMRDLGQLRPKYDELVVEVKECKAEIAAKSESLGEYQAQLESLGDEIKRLNSVNESMKSQSLSDAKAVDAARLAYDTQTTEVENLKVLVKDLQTKLDQATEKSVSSSKSNEQVLDAIKNLEWTLSKKMRQSSETTVKQVESYMGIRDYLASGEKGLSFHGWPISSQVGLYLLGLIEENDYQCVIEFGSGTSTAMFAEAMLKKAKRREEIQDDRDRGIRSGQLMDISRVGLVPSAHDLPRSVISFEHDKLYLEKTARILESRGYEDLVSLVYAPLLEQDLGGQSWLYYNCNQTLSSLSSVVGEASKILVLIDGPPQQTGEKARYPALPMLLKHLGVCSFDILVDDYARPAEREIVQDWCSYLDKRSYRYTGEEIEAEKGAYLLRVN